MHTQKDLRSRYTRWRWTIGSLAAVFLAASLVFAYWGWGHKIECGGVKFYQTIVLAAWMLLPPIWFWYEYFFRGYILLRSSMDNTDCGQDFPYLRERP
jgi:hypothetical protein